MADVFVSYANEDEQQARLLAERLEANGWSVWSDRTIPPGETWADVIERELEAAACVVVLWSSHSVKSRWVKAEAGEAADRGVLVPALIGDVKIPLQFKPIQAANLVGWDGASPHQDFNQLMESIADTVRAGEDQDTSKASAHPVIEPEPQKGLLGSLGRRLRAVHYLLAIGGVAALAMILPQVGMWPSGGRTTVLLAPLPDSLAVGDSIELPQTLAGNNREHEVQWSSLDPMVAEIAGGSQLFAFKRGAVRIEAQGENVAALDTIQVHEPAPRPRELSSAPDDPADADWARLLHPVHFGFDSWLVREVDRPILDEYVNIMLADSQMTLRLVGFADPGNLMSTGLALPALRAKSVKAYLVNRGVEPNRISLYTSTDLFLRRFDGMSGVENRAVAFFWSLFTVHFSGGEISGRSMPLLDEFARAVMLRFNDLIGFLTWHDVVLGDADGAEQQAEAVRQYLLDKGVSSVSLCPTTRVEPVDGETDLARDMRTSEANLAVLWSGIGAEGRYCYTSRMPNGEAP